MIHSLVLFDRKKMSGIVEFEPAHYPYEIRAINVSTPVNAGHNPL